MMKTNNNGKRIRAPGARSCFKEEMLVKESLGLHLRTLSWLLSIPLVGMIYVYLNHAGGPAHSLVTDMDRQIPFLKIFIVPYLSWYAFLFVTFVYLAVKHKELYFQTLVKFLLGLLICYGVYAVYQTYVPRPVLTGDGFLDRLVGFVYSSDEPLNCFPSTHVITAYLMMKAFVGSAVIPRLYKVIVTVISVVIIISTQFVKQHVLLDIVGAVLVAEGVIYVVNRWCKGWLGKFFAGKSPAFPVETAGLMGTMGTEKLAAAARTIHSVGTSGTVKAFEGSPGKR